MYTGIGRISSRQLNLVNSEIHEYVVGLINLFRDNGKITKYVSRQLYERIGPLGDLVEILIVHFTNTLHNIVIYPLAVELLSHECHRTPLMKIRLSMR